MNTKELLASYGITEETKRRDHSFQFLYNTFLEIGERIERTQTCIADLPIDDKEWKELEWSLKIEYYIYLVRDNRGNQRHAICEEDSETIQIAGLINKNGKEVYFEEDAYRLKDWCKQNGLQWRIIKKRNKFHDLWPPRPPGVWEKFNTP